MPKMELPFRQVHLDYHTSELIEGVGRDFDKDQFIKMVKKGHVNQICCFARCHHGWMYFDSKTDPDRIHPHLENKNLLRQQIDAGKENGFRVPIYTTIQWDDITANQKPEWLCHDQSGEILRPMFDVGFYRYLCVNSPYRDWIKAHTQDIIDNFPDADGFFFDIVWPLPCCCEYCRTLMKEKGYDPRSIDDVYKFALITINDFTNDLSEFVWERLQNASIYYNSGAVIPGNRGSIEAFSHIEFDALPSGHGDYKDFPIRTRFDRTLGWDYVGQTGKFHTGWGDLHSFKNKTAMEYECFLLLALGGKCLIGDQLMPNGVMDENVYELIGSVYSQVEQKEKWCSKITPVVEIGILTPDEFSQNPEYREALTGAAMMLNEAGFQYDIVDSISDYSKYKLLILPDRIEMDDVLTDKIKAYIKSGGKVLASFESGMDAENNVFILNELGVVMQTEQLKARDGELARGRAIYRSEVADYIYPTGEIGSGLKQTEHVMYSKCVQVDAMGDAEVLTFVMEPVFYRTHDHYYSHMQAPSKGVHASAGVVGTDNTIYFAHAIFGLYRQYGMFWCRQMVVNALDILLGERLIKDSGPSTMLTTINNQTEKSRLVLHMLHYIPERRTVKMEIIEDVIPIYNINVSISAIKDVKNIYLAPQMTPIDYKIENGRINFTIDEVNGHQMVVLDYLIN